MPNFPDGKYKENNDKKNKDDKMIVLVSFTTILW